MPPAWLLRTVVMDNVGEIRPLDVDPMGGQWPWLRFGSS